jgi:hypothetical protein
MILKATCVAATLTLAMPAAADVTFIDFESDAPGPVPNGFMSADAGLLVSFSDSDGSDLVIGDFGIESDGQGLQVGDDDFSLLLMEFSELMNSLSLEFGNDDPAFTDVGDAAVLTVYLGGIEVGQSSVIMNRNDAMDQTISISGVEFDSASLDYYVSSDGVYKVVDNIAFNTVPGPGALALLAGFGLLPLRRKR